MRKITPARNVAATYIRQGGHHVGYWPYLFYDISQQNVPVLPKTGIFIGKTEPFHQLNGDNLTVIKERHYFFTALPSRAHFAELLHLNLRNSLVRNRVLVAKFDKTLDF